MELTADPNRRVKADATGIYVRAKRANKWDTVDIAELNKASLLAWLRSRGGENPWAENTVGQLLGHGQLID